uniref:Placental growth factor n=1 Tax=Bos taurus TaxID=9913 RepID=A0AAA9SM36_BOVIN
MPTVRLFTCFLQLLTGLVLPAVPTTDLPLVPFQQVWSRSYCRPVERLVDIVSEYPSEMEHLFSPSCVSLMRCTGCCSDESMHCVPLETANVTMQLMKYRSLDQPFFVEMSFSQHVRCECKWQRQDQTVPGGAGTLPWLPRETASLGQPSLAQS